MNKRLYILSLIFLTLFVNVYSQDKDGTYNFLNMTSSSRVAALGGVMLPINDFDIQIVTSNPSLINSGINNSLSLSYVDYYNDINMASFRYGRDFDKIGSFVATIDYHNYGDFYYANENGTIENNTWCQLEIRWHTIRKQLFICGSCRCCWYIYHKDKLGVFSRSS